MSYGITSQPTNYTNPDPIMLRTAAHMKAEYLESAGYPDPPDPEKNLISSSVSTEIMPTRVAKVTESEEPQGSTQIDQDASLTRESPDYSENNEGSPLFEGVKERGSPAFDIWRSKKWDQKILHPISYIFPGRWAVSWYFDALLLLKENSGEPFWKQAKLIVFDIILSTVWNFGVTKLKTLLYPVWQSFKTEK